MYIMVQFDMVKNQLQFPVISVGTENHIIDSFLQQMEVKILKTVVLSMKNKRLQHTVQQ